MAHGTGYYWNRIYEADIIKDEYAVMFYRCNYYYYPTMSDSYEPTCDIGDEYEVAVVRFRNKHSFGGTITRVADHLSESVKIAKLTKQDVNRIWYNISKGRLA